MNKKVLTLMITAGMAMSALTACEKTAETEKSTTVETEEITVAETEESTAAETEEDTVAETEETTTEVDESEALDEILDEIQDELEEFDASNYYSVEAYGLDDAILLMTSVDEEGQEYEEETGSWGTFGTAGSTMSDLMAEWNITSFEATCSDGDFCGWTALQNIIEIDENDFENVTQEALYDGKIFTTEEMMSLELPDGDVVFYAVWEFDCSGCQEHKVCNAYYIDDDCYLVCDDCYEEFAYGMGLIE